MNSRFFNYCFLAAGNYSHFQTSMMLLLSYCTGCYSNTLMDANTNVPVKSIVLILRHFFFISQFSSFCWWGCNIFLHAGSE